MKTPSPCPDAPAGGRSAKYCDQTAGRINVDGNASLRCAYVDVDIDIDVYICIYIHTYIHTFIHVCIYIYI